MNSKNLGTRYEDYENLSLNRPFVLNSNILRDKNDYSHEMNWHDNVEIQWVKEGNGTVILDNCSFNIKKDDIIVVNSNVIHYTGFNDYLIYSCVIIDTKLLNYVGIDSNHFSSIINDDKILFLLNEFEKNNFTDDKLSNIKMHKILLEILIILSEKYIDDTFNSQNKVCHERIKKIILYIRQHYTEKITLDDISKEVLIDKYLLVKEFKKITGMTIFTYINDLRCKKATQLIREGYSVNQASFGSGFNNLSYFTKTYKSRTGSLPSKIKNIR